MQNLKIYLLIKDAVTDESLNMDGNFEIFKTFLSGLNKSIAQDSLPLTAQADPAPITALPAEDPKRSEGKTHVKG